MTFNQIRYSIKVNLVIALFFVLLSVGFMTAIGQDSSQNPPEGYDKGVWVLTNTALQNSTSQPWGGTYPMYSQPERIDKWTLQMSENSHTGTTAIAGPKGPDAGYPTATSYTVSWSSWS